MNRREFTIGSGAAVTAAVFAQACGRASAGPRPVGVVDPEDPVIVEALRFGITAPSAHNTQPWRIELVNDREALVFVDPRRLLPKTDPPGRQVHISHGTFVETTAIAATHFGHHAEVELLPDGEMSSDAFGTRPTARIRLASNGGQPEDPLFRRILSRRSSRLPHDGAPLTPREIGTVSEAARHPGVRVDSIPEDRLVELFGIVREAMAIEVRDHDIYDETRLWFRFSKREVARNGDGLSVATAGLTGFSAGTANLFLNSRNWHKEKNLDRYLETFAKTVERTNGLLTLTTSTNAMSDWLQTGRAYVRAQLAADAIGLRFHPVSQVLQEYSQMSELRARFNEGLGVHAPAKVQMLVRVGRTETPGLSPRRPLGAILHAA